MNHEFTRDISKLEKYARKYRLEKFKKYGLRANQHSIIIALNHHPGISQDELAKKISIDKSGVARQLAGLEENGFIYRKISEKDKRVTEVYPTEKSQEVYKEVKEILDNWYEFLSEAISAQEEEILTSSLLKLINRAQEYPFEEE